MQCEFFFIYDSFFISTHFRFGIASQTVEFPVPANRAGVVIGKGGENIRLIKEKSGAFVQIEKSGDGDKDPAWKTFIIRKGLLNSD